MSAIERLALLYSDGSFGVFAADITIEKARKEREFVDVNEKDPARLTKIGRVRLEIIETFDADSATDAPRCPTCGRRHEAHPEPRS